MFLFQSTTGDLMYGIIIDYEFLAYVCIVNKKRQYTFVVINLLSQSCRRIKGCIEDI